MRRSGNTALNVHGDFWLREAPVHTQTFESHVEPVWKLVCENNGSSHRLLEAT